MDTSDEFKFIVKAGGIMDVVERYPWTGEEQQHKRRDKRAGYHVGRVIKTDDGPEIR